jgi:hypothetical protein
MMDPDIQRVAQRFRDLFGVYEESSTQFPPHYKNAAHAGFPEDLLDDASYLVYRQFNSDGLQGDTARLMDVYVLFRDEMHRAFADNPPYKGSWLGNPVILGQYWDALAGDILQIVALGIALAIPGVAGPAIITALTNRCKALVDHAQTLGIAVNGRHMNGWTAVGIHHAAEETQHRLDDWWPNANTDAGQVARVLKGVMQQLIALKTDNHEPWLTSDYQIRLTTICATAVITLNTYS